MNFIKIGLIAAAAILATGCTRIETGSVGVRIDYNRQVQPTELLPGSWAQTVIGDVLKGQTKDLIIELNNKTPLTSDNSALADFDVTVVYNVNPTSVAELYGEKSKSFHAIDGEGRVLVMHSRIAAFVDTAAYKAVRQYKALEVADNRAKIEQDMLELINDSLKNEKLDDSITVSVVQVRNIAANADIMQAATNYVRSQNDLKIKENEVKIAEAEARRMSVLAQNSQQSIAYMNAQSLAAIAEGVKNGSVSSVIVPYDFKGIINVGK